MRKANQFIPPKDSGFRQWRIFDFDIDDFFREMCVILDRLGDKYYGRCVVKLGDPPTPFGVGGLNSIALASVPYRHISILSQ